jgi:hypothetical protein
VSPASAKISGRVDGRCYAESPQTALPGFAAGSSSGIAAMMTVTPYVLPSSVLISVRSPDSISASVLLRND